MRAHALFAQSENSHGTRAYAKGASTTTLHKIQPLIYGEFLDTKQRRILSPISRNTVKTGPFWIALRSPVGFCNVVVLAAARKARLAFVLCIVFHRRPKHRSLLEDPVHRPSFLGPAVYITSTWLFGMLGAEAKNPLIYGWAVGDLNSGPADKSHFPIKTRLLVIRCSLCWNSLDVVRPLAPRPY
jgi:hypothetical protein